MQIYSVSLTWPDTQPKAVLANQFAVALGLPTASGTEEIYLTIGTAEPAFALEGSSSEPGVLSVKPLLVDVQGRYVFTRGKLGELIALLQRAATAYDEAVGDDDAEDSTSEQ